MTGNRRRWQVGGGWIPSLKTESQRETNLMKMMTCPTAAKPADVLPETGASRGGTYRAWRIETRLASPLWGSYGMNVYIPFAAVRAVGYRPDPRMWTTADVSRTATIPVLLDGGWVTGAVYHAELAPPQFDLIPTMPVSPPPPVAFCMNRHWGHVNGLFMDWSVRKVGLKELWTLKWSTDFDTAGPWTKAGGVQPENWPEWMRRFKDY